MAYTWDPGPRPVRTVTSKVKRGQAERRKYGLNYNTRVMHKMFPNYGIGIVSAFRSENDGMLDAVGVLWPDGDGGFSEVENFHQPGLLHVVKAKKSDPAFKFKIHVRTKREE